MGACGSTNADADAEAAREAQEEQEQKGTKEESPKASPRSKEKDGDFDFRETLRGVTCAVLERLGATLEYEGERYQELAVKLGHQHYMELFAPQHFERVLRDALEIKKVAEPDVERSNLAYEQQRFANFIAKAQKARFKDPPPSRKAFAKAMQDAARKSAEALKQGAAQAKEDLKEHLEFFARTFAFMQGDIWSEGSQLLYQNIDRMCDVDN